MRLRVMPPALRFAASRLHENRYVHSMSAFFAKHWFTFALVVGVGAALAFPDVVRRATEHVELRLGVAASLFLVAVTMPTASLMQELRYPYASLWAVTLSYTLVPLIACGLGPLAPMADVRIGLLIIGSVPCTLAAAILWTRLAGGNEACALLTVMGTTFASWGATTAWLYGLTGASLQLDAFRMMADLVLTLIAPVVTGQLVRLIPPCAEFVERRKLFLGVLSQVLIVAIVVTAAVVVGDKLHEAGAWQAPAIFLWSIGLALAVHLLALTGGLWSSHWLGFERGRQIAVAFASSQKTLPVALLLYDQFFKSEYPFAVIPILFYHLGQLLVDSVIAKRLLRASASETSAVIADSI